MNVELMLYECRWIHVDGSDLVSFTCDVGLSAFANVHMRHMSLLAKAHQA